MPNYKNYLLRLEQLSLSEVLLSIVYYIPGLAIYKLHLNIYESLKKTILTILYVHMNCTRLESTHYSRISTSKERKRQNGDPYYPTNIAASPKTDSFLYSHKPDGTPPSLFKACHQKIITIFNEE